MTYAYVRMCECMYIECLLNIGDHSRKEYRSPILKGQRGTRVSTIFPVHVRKHIENRQLFKEEQRGTNAAAMLSIRVCQTILKIGDRLRKDSAEQTCANVF